MCKPSSRHVSISSMISLECISEDVGSPPDRLYLSAKRRIFDNRTEMLERDYFPEASLSHC